MEDLEITDASWYVSTFWSKLILIYNNIIYQKILWKDSFKLSCYSNKLHHVSIPQKYKHNSYSFVYTTQKFSFSLISSQSRQTLVARQCDLCIGRGIGYDCVMSINWYRVVWIEILFSFYFASFFFNRLLRVRASGPKRSRDSRVIITIKFFVQ